MPSTSETVLAALTSRIAASTSATVIRGTAIPQDVPAIGLVMVGDGEPGEPEVCLSPLRYHFEHLAELAVYVQDGADKEAAFDALKLEIAAALAADRTLGGLCDWVEAQAPETSDLALPGAAEFKAGMILVLLMYATTDPLT